MNSQLQSLTIEEATVCLIDYRGKTPPKTERGVRLVTAKVIKDGQIRDEPAEYIAEDFYDEWMRRGLPCVGDVLLTTEAPLGELARILHDERIALAQRVILLRANPDRVDPTYLFYALRCPQGQAELRARATGTTVLGIKQSELRQVRVPVFPLGAQRRIGDVLSGYDALIDNCERRVKVLDEMARALYREWFVEFRYLGHEGRRAAHSTRNNIPSGWRSERLDSVVRVNAEQVSVRNAPTQIRYIDISSVSPDRIDQATPMAFSDAPGRARRVVRHGDILWSCVRPNRRSYALVMNPEPNTLASTGFAVLTAEKIPCAYLYLATTTDEFVKHLEQRATGAAYPAVTAAVFEAAPLLIPEAGLLERFAQACEPIFELKESLRRRVDNLRATRDQLLPRLLSGQLSVAEVA